MQLNLSRYLANVRLYSWKILLILILLDKFDSIIHLTRPLLQAEYKKGQEDKRAKRRELEDNYNSYKGLFHKTSPSKSGFESESGFKSESSFTYSEDAVQSEVSPEAVDIDEYDASGKNPFFDGD